MRPLVAVPAAKKLMVMETGMSLPKCLLISSSRKCRPNKSPLLPLLSSAKMPRSAIDATRFTSTTPYASAKPSAPSSPSNQASKIPSRFPGPPGETPQQKVKRLRAAAAAARNAQITTMDRVILRGRVWADKLHKFTALTLIGCTCTSTLIYPCPSIEFAGVALGY